MKVIILHGGWSILARRLLRPFLVLVESSNPKRLLELRILRAFDTSSRHLLVFESIKVRFWSFSRRRRIDLGARLISLDISMYLKRAATDVIDKFLFYVGFYQLFCNSLSIASLNFKRPTWTLARSNDDSLRCNIYLAFQGLK